MSNYYYKKTFKSAAPAAALAMPQAWQQERAARNAQRYGFTANGGAVNHVITLSNGNKKLIGNSRVQFLVWNTPAAVTCPNANADCLGECYAEKSEQGPRAASVLKCRYNNLNASLTAEFVPAMTELIADIIATKRVYKSAKKIVVRIHESGDFYSAEYFNKWIEIAQHFSSDPRLVFVAYTKSVDYVPAQLPANVVIRFSIWNATAPQDIKKAAALGLPVYTAVPTFTSEPAAQRCNCIDCGTCFKCFTNKFELLKCEIH